MVITNRHIESMQVYNEEKRDSYEFQTQLNENSLKEKFQKPVSPHHTQKELILFQ